MKIYNKLIRDNIPDIMDKENVKYKVHILNDNEYKEALNKKLVEELNEYLSEYDINELADLSDVIDALVIALGYTKDEFTAIKKKKCEKNGRFDKKLFLESVDD